VRTSPLPLGHAFGERYELPLPLWMFVVGGAAVVLLSFLLVLRRAPVVAPVPDVPDVVPVRRAAPVAGGLAVLLTLVVALRGLTGTQEVSDSVAPLYLWLGLWVVVPLTVGLLGDWTRPVNPFAHLARLGDHAGLRKAVLARTAPLPWRAGWWPAVTAFVLLVLGELVFQLDTTGPAFVGTALLGYGFLCLFLGLLFGDGFTTRGEVFSAVWDAWGRLGFLRFGQPGRRGFAGGLDLPFAADAGRVVLVLLLLVSINVDGLLSTPQWASYERETVGIDGLGLEVLRIASLAVLVVAVVAVFAAFARAALRVGGVESGPLAALATLLPSLVPIAYGYLVAHYLQYVVTNGQLLLPVLGDDGYVVDVELFPTSFYWYLSVVVIVVVHVVAVVLANRVIAGRVVDPARARRAELPWLVAMVGYTALSLWLIAQPLTSASG
jgi:hypothetical protein